MVFAGFLRQRHLLAKCPAQSFSFFCCLSDMSSSVGGILPDSKAGLEGIKKELPVPSPVEGNLYDDSKELWSFSQELQQL